MSTTVIKNETCKDCLLQETPACLDCWRNSEAKTDKALHEFMKKDYSEAIGSTEKDGYRAIYHESRLYSVRNIKSGIVSLVYACSPYDAIEIVKSGGRNE